MAPTPSETWRSSATAPAERRRWSTRSPSCPAPAAATASIKDGTTLTDYSPDEIERKHSINLGLGYAEWLDTKINLIDTPGYLDYFGEVVTGLHAADAAVVVLSGTGGVEVGTEKVWEVCDQLHLPRVLFVSLMDKEHADFERVFQDVKAHLTPKVVPVEIPIGDGPRLPRDHQPVLRPLPLLQEGHQDRRVRGGADPARVPGALSRSTPSS